MAALTSQVLAKAIGIIMLVEQAKPDDPQEFRHLIDAAIGELLPPDEAEMALLVVDSLLNFKESPVFQQIERAAVKEVEAVGTWCCGLKKPVPVAVPLPPVPLPPAVLAMLVPPMPPGPPSLARF
jgi:hypothetical protein